MNRRVRKTIRLKDYDYSRDGYYFITINTYCNQYLFGEIVDGEMILNDVGEMINKYYLKLGGKYDNIKCHEYIIMPNHVHFIIEINNEISVHKLKAMDLFDAIYYFKSFTTHRYIENVENKDWKRFYKKIWHHSYYEHIIRNRDDYLRIENYIKLNPRNWRNKNKNN